jgi:integration host factor subunit beta
MTKSELISLLAAKQPQLDYRDVELAVKELLNKCPLRCPRATASKSAVSGFSLHYRPPRTGRNPKTGAAVQVPDKFVPISNLARS